MSTEHELKVWSNYFKPMVRGNKPFDLRYNDRGYKPADNVLLREYDKFTKIYSGKALRGRISYILPLRYFVKDVDPNWVILGLPKLELVFDDDNDESIVGYTDDLNPLLDGSQPFLIVYDQYPEPGQKIVIGETGSGRTIEAYITVIQPLRLTRADVRMNACIVGLRDPLYRR